MKRTTIFIALVAVAATAGAQSDSLKMDSVMRTLPEVMIHGERPTVKVEPGKMVFDLPRIIEGKGITNAFDALKELPGMTEQDGHLQLMGQGFTVFIDGKPSTMSLQQLEQYLKRLPARRLRNAEVVFAAPARYQVRGQVVNLRLLRDETRPILQGQAQSGYEQKHEAMFNESLNIYVQRGRWSADAMYGAQHGRSFYNGHTQSLHSQTSGEVYDIQSHTQSLSKLRQHDYRLGLDYGSQLGLTYTGNHETSRTRGTTEGNIVSEAASRGRHALHNLNADYRSPFGLHAGADYTRYNAPSNGRVSSVLPTGNLDYETRSRQRIDRWKLHASMEHKDVRGWGLNYGLSWTGSHDRSYQRFNLDGMNSEARQRENVTQLYAGTSRSLGSRFSFEASLEAEWYRNAAFDEWAFFPVVSATYTPATSHVLQFALSGNRSYPDYWAVTSARGFTDGGYGEVWGNPSLRPSKDYDLRMIYLLRSKYQFSLWFSHRDDYFVQTCYQRQNRLVMDYRNVNFDFRRQAGLMAHAPLQIGRWLRCSATAYLLWNRERDSDYYDLPFDRSIVSVMANLRNTIIFSPLLSLNVNGFARSKSYQGLYDLPASGNLTVELVAHLMKQRLTAKASAANILLTTAIHPEMNYATQHYVMGYSDYREFALTLTYNFGDYKEKRHPEVDASRFRK